ncbi:Gfo/Idh/MocA family oxidoreductase [uncultured Paludibaculum sp.]|uniref:Gfo/Idh/MocA family protein n=1 Tax=uncultured Paludibaculum sp. TaxID=1765020 RepID=UPI002AAB7419|nr:Gfo/Idh/MocA family oxidoreductase [uncultured Paludibaculum sp.]
MTLFRTLALATLAASVFAQDPAPPLRLAIAGLVHGHVDGFLRAARAKHVQIVGVYDPDTKLHAKYAEKYHLEPGVFFTNLNTMLDKTKPEAVASFTSTFDHPVVVQAAAARKIHVMMEKPLAVNMEHARAIHKAATAAGIHVIVNYETTWYRSHGAIYDLVKKQKAIGDVRKMVAMDGHQGPKEIGVGPEFLGWLTDPVKNGAGALFDFGCYGANLMTWLMDGQRPIAVTAITQRIKPEIYSKVDDEANVLVEYPKAIGIIEGSWNWPYSRKDLEVYAEKGVAIAVGGNILRTRQPGRTDERTETPDALPPDESDSISYLTAIVRGRLKPSGLSSLENNMVVTEILEAARESARTGRRVTLK